MTVAEMVRTSPVNFNALLDIRKAENPQKGDFILEAFAATSDLDLQGDVISPEAIKASEKDLEKNSTVLFNHNSDRPIGKVLFSEARPGGLFVRIRISEIEEEIQKKIQEGVLNKLSIQGQILDRKEAFDPDSGKMTIIILKMLLAETSIVSVPANSEARSLAWYIQKALTSGGDDEAAKKAAEVKKEIADQVLSKQQEGIEIQTLLFDKEKWTVDAAVKWAGEHDFRTDKVDEEENIIRLRQFDPENCVVDSFATFPIQGVDGVQAVGCRRKAASGDPQPDVSARLARLESVVAGLSKADIPDEAKAALGQAIELLSQLEMTDEQKSRVEEIKGLLGKVSTAIAETSDDDDNGDTNSDKSKKSDDDPPAPANPDPANPDPAAPAPANPDPAPAANQDPNANPDGTPTGNDQLTKMIESLTATVKEVVERQRQINGVLPVARRKGMIGDPNANDPKAGDKSKPRTNVDRIRQALG